MRMVYTFLFALVVIFNSIEHSLQSAGNPHSRNNPGPSVSNAAGKQHSLDRASPEEAPVRARSRSPDSRSPSTKVLGYSLLQLGYIRLIPRTNESLQFEFRKYVFSNNQKLRMKIDNMSYFFELNQEYLVLSTPNHEAFAIIDNSDILRGVYRASKQFVRVKINMITGEIEKLTPNETRDCPVGKNHPIFPQRFIKAYSNYDSLHPDGNSNEQRNPGSSSSDRQHLRILSIPNQPPVRAGPSSPPGRPPSHEVLGYSLANLGYIRLIPQENQNRRFEFRRYVIPANKEIRLQIERNCVPVPRREYIVLSTSNGDVFAILEHTGILRGIYSTKTGHPRVKINMISGAVERMTAIELKECHVGIRYPIFPRWFNEVFSSEDSLQHVYR